MFSNKKNDKLTKGEEAMMQEGLDVFEQTALAVVKVLSPHMISPINVSAAICGAFKGLEEMLITLKQSVAELEAKGIMPDAAKGLKHLITQLFYERAAILLQLTATPDADVESLYKELQKQFGKDMARHSADAEAIADGKEPPKEVTN